MRVLVNNSTGQHWLFNDETNKIIIINKTGASKVASVCRIDKEYFSDKELTIIIKDIRDYGEI